MEHPFRVLTVSYRCLPTVFIVSFLLVIESFDSPNYPGVSTCQGNGTSFFLEKTLSETVYFQQ